MVNKLSSRRSGDFIDLLIRRGSYLTESDRDSVQARRCTLFRERLVNFFRSGLRNVALERVYPRRSRPTGSKNLLFIERITSSSCEDMKGSAHLRFT